MRDRQTCVDCGKLSPETETNYTLISSQFGWRLTRWRGERGEFHVEWRCPDCWRNYKKAKQAADETGTPLRPSMPPGGLTPSARPPPLQTRPLPSFPSHPPAPIQGVGPLPPMPRPPRSIPPDRGTMPPPPFPRKPR